MQQKDTTHVLIPISNVKLLSPKHPDPVHHFRYKEINYKYTLIIIAWKLIFYVKRAQKGTVSKADSSCIESEL